MDSRRVVLAILALLLCAGIGTAFMIAFERVEREIDIGFQGEARRNPLLAAQRFLEAQGYRVETVDTLERLLNLPDPGDLIILPTQRMTLDETRVEPIWDWLSDGGRLVVMPGRRDEPDPLLDPLGVRRADGDREDASAEFTAAGLSRPLKVEMQRVTALLDPEGEAVWTLLDDKDRIVGLEYAIGDGRLTVFPDLDFIDNRHIGDADHAALLWWLAGESPGKIWLVRNDDMPGLPAWLAAKAPALLISAGVMLLVWLFSAGQRFGPLLPPPLPARRSLREHLRASGRFLWRHGSPGVLLEAVRRTLREEIARRHPEWLQLDADELHQRLAEHGDLSPEQVRAALLDPAGQTTHFTQHIQHLEALRNSL